MGRSLNKVMLIGHLGRNAETSYTASQVAVTKFSVATSRRWKDQTSGEWKEETDWTNIVLWRAEKLAEYLTKGQQVYVEGRIQTRTYEKDGVKHWVTEVIAENVILCGGKPGDRSHRPEGESTPCGSTKDGIGDDDVPF